MGSLRTTSCVPAAGLENKRLRRGAEQGASMRGLGAFVHIGKRRLSGRAVAGAAMVRSLRGIAPDARLTGGWAHCMIECATCCMAGSPACVVVSVL